MASKVAFLAAVARGDSPSGTGQSRVWVSMTLAIAAFVAVLSSSLVRPLTTLTSLICWLVSVLSRPCVWHGRPARV
jgi:hypothetical protein